MRWLRALSLLLLVAVVAGPAPAAPQGLAAAQPDALATAFAALPEPDRRGLQDALTWTGDFNGVVAGLYGPRTRDALLAHARRSGLPPVAILDEAPRRRLLAEAEAARRAVGFMRLRDARAGLAIGLPARLLPARTPLPDGTRYAAPDGAATLDTLGRPGGADALAEIFARLTRDAPGRRVTYRLARPDAVVATGEAGDGRFYARYALAGAPDGASAVRGFTFTYPAGRPDLDRIVLAVAASFDPQPPPFPAAPAPAAASAPILAGVAVLVAPGLALTSADPRLCPDASVDGVPARWSRQDPDSGLALLALPAHAEATAPVLAPPPVPGAPAARYALFFAAADGPPRLSAALAGEAGPGRAELPLQGAEAGVPLFDADGALAGLVAAHSGRTVAVRGVLASARYRVVEAGRIAAFLRDAAVAAAPAAGAAPTTGGILVRWRGAVLPLRCRAPA